MSAYAFQQVDVFATAALKGNPLAVVLGADALTDRQMAEFANWTNLSETTFLLQPTAPDASPPEAAPPATEEPPPQR